MKAKHDDAYDEENEGFGVKPSATLALIAEVDNAPLKPYTDTPKEPIAPTPEKENTVAETETPAKSKVDNSKIRALDPKLIKVEDGFNARDFTLKENKEHVEELSRSIAKVGVLEALTVRYDTKTGEYILVNGESRLRATLLAIEKGAPIKEVPVNFERKGTSAEDRIATLITRNEGKQLEVIEQGEVFSRLDKLGWSQKQIADATGKTGPFIGAVLKLMAGPEKLKALVRSGQIKASLAIDILRNADFDYEKAYAALSDAIATAAAVGKTKATAQHVDPKAKKKKKGDGTPLHFQRSSVTVFIDVLAAFAADTALNRGLRNKAKNALENAGIDYKQWIKDTTEEEDEE